MPARLIDGKQTAAAYRERVKADVAAFTQKTGVTPHLAAVVVGENPASAVYVRNKQRACEQAGIGSSLHALPESASQADLLALVQDLNADPAVHGILVQLPLPGQIDERAVLDAVAPLKDVDCFHPENVGLLSQGRPRFAPCTPAGVMELLAAAEVPTASARAVVLGRSEIVGKPMAMLLLARGADATVTVCHSRTADLAAVCREADVLIAAIGRAKFLTADMVKPGAAVIDVGINRLPDSEGGGLAGDVDYDAVNEVAGALTPVPGGVGPMTVAVLLRNTLTAAELQTAGEPG
ncbi:bifunctional methylenetetrahydrofolate dehydrogenase/methenyltetrahydrofolate cyclohydrolase FolD [Alienimonas californiensis]|uniref:Bifunctional protein FolD n=1 Tax=Alienimonas californiensis TaxID=2527989 RepID=A0A517P8B4_9PLAN|nr:bifunctional methylenetetrahydrofolate dehydrogenase/methenyltetrahydrofolate cyclohydrolase FolD [Alienimonas californiensis]QDT15620.1 Tetrahydrofolate dehydrogenase/cyclohydrolase [Alienimonas californiensis]